MSRLGLPMTVCKDLTPIPSPKARGNTDDQSNDQTEGVATVFVIASDACGLSETNASRLLPREKPARLTAVGRGIGMRSPPASKLQHSVLIDAHTAATAYLVHRSPKQPNKSVYLVPV
jgi:hypothetical protein